MNRLRASFAAKLLVGGLLLALVVIGGVSAYLLVSREGQTRAGALSNSDNRAEVMREVLLRFTGAQSFSTARGLAAQPGLAQALSSTDPRTIVPALFAASPPVDLADEVLVITGAQGEPLFARADPSLGNVTATPYEQSSAIGFALRGATCGLGGATTRGACGVELLSGGDPAYSVAVPVVSGGAVVGVVGYIAPLQYQLDRFDALFQFPTAFIPARDPQLEIRQRGGRFVAAAAPPDVVNAIASHSDIAHATYSAPSTSGAPADVAGSFAAVSGPDGHTTAGYVGVEVPLAPFAGDAGTDELTLVVITIFALLVTAILIILFVELVVRRPIHRLERGVARIAGGDFTTPVTVRSRDELGRLATGVNRMRDSIAQYTSELHEARTRLDSAIEKVSGVSRALTTTTGGVRTLQREVVRTAAAIAGGDTTAVLAIREGDAMVVRAVHPPDSSLTDLYAWDESTAVLSGTIVRQERPGHGTLLAFPMFYQDQVVGALAIVARTDQLAAAEDAERVLTVLANNAAIAMENARLYEQERETVARLRQLDQMKTEFLGTVQHELRTPLTAILGLSDLIEMCWDVWEDKPKLDAVRDIQLAARNLYDIVETIIDFTIAEGETVGISAQDVPLRDAVAEAVQLLQERAKGGLPVPVHIDIADDLVVHADPERFNQVLRAVIDNAVKFSDGKGEVTVRATRADETDRVRIQVIDEGIGIPSESLPRIFERFYQVDNSATRRYGGTGMGLALAKRFIDAHGASVAVTSTLGAGTHVVLEWPTASPVVPEPEVVESPNSNGRVRRSSKRREEPVRH
jgi:signal transduction histidine kinase